MDWFDRIVAGEALSLSEELRASLPGGFVQLRDGVTHYELGGPEGGELVVLVHGFSVPNFIWDPTFAALTQAGFRVLRYDLFGRGYSDRPNLRNNKALFVKQLHDLLERVSPDGKAAIVSLSMGGPIAAEFARKHPERVGSMVFIDPAGFDLGLPAAVQALRLPLVGEFFLGMLGRFGRRGLLQSMLSDFYRPSPGELEAFAGRYQEQRKYRGFKRSLLSTLRNGLLDEDLQAYAELGRSAVEVLLVWGREDRTVPFRYHKDFLELVPQSQFQAIDDAGHIPHFERPEVVNPRLIDFLRAQSL